MIGLARTGRQALTADPPDLVVLDCEQCPLEKAERCAAFVRWASALVLVVHEAAISTGLILA